MPKVFTTGQIAKMCKVSCRTVVTWFDKGQLRGYRIPGSKDRRVPHENLVRFLRENGMPLNGLDGGEPEEERKPYRSITGKPADGPGIWVIDADQAVELVTALEVEEIHNLRSTPGLGCFLGAHWSKDDVLELLRTPGKRIGLIFPPQITNQHQLVVLSHDTRWAFDIGDVSELRMRALRQQPVKEVTS